MIIKFRLQLLIIKITKLARIHDNLGSKGLNNNLVGNEPSTVCYTPDLVQTSNSGRLVSTSSVFKVLILKMAWIYHRLYL